MKGSNLFINWGWRENESLRAIFSFLVGSIFIFSVLRIFEPNSFDYENMRRGTQALIQGVNPWNPEARISHFYTPPFRLFSCGLC